MLFADCWGVFLGGWRSTVFRRRSSVRQKTVCSVSVSDPAMVWKGSIILQNVILHGPNSNTRIRLKDSFFLYLPCWAAESASIAISQNFCPYFSMLELWTGTNHIFSERGLLKVRPAGHDWNSETMTNTSLSHRVTEVMSFSLLSFGAICCLEKPWGTSAISRWGCASCAELGKGFSGKNHFPTNNWSNAVPFQTFTSFFDNVIYLSLFIFKRNPISSHPFQLLFKHFNLLELNFRHFQPRGNSHLLDRDVVWTVGCGGKLENILPHHWILFLSLFYGFLALVDWAYEIISMWEDGGFWQNCWRTFP